jgi:enoyl-CoA hydratase/carnithine racemase
VKQKADGSCAVAVERLDGATMLCFTSPILSREVLDDLTSALEGLACEDAREPVIFRSEHPSVFLAGAHLAEIADLDAASCMPYAEHGRRVVQHIESFPAPTIAAVNGSCSGGGFDLVLACDVIVAGPEASFEHPGIRRGLVTGWSGTMHLPALIGGARARAALLETRRLDASSMADGGAILRTADDPFGTALKKARHLAWLDPVRWQLWRALKGPRFVDRFYASVVHKLLR